MICSIFKLNQCNIPTLLSNINKTMASSRKPSIRAPNRVLDLLVSLHAKSLDQESVLHGFPSTSMPRKGTPDFDNLMVDKFIALDQDKCEFVYQLLRAMRATTIVEAGTSFGVSTIYLALAAGQNAAAMNGTGISGPGIDTGTGVSAKVIATEKEESKATRAREHWALAGKEVQDVIDLRVDDLRETLKRDIEDVDFLLLDIWTPLALPAFKAVEPHFRPGAVIVVDNTLASQSEYAELFEYVNRAGSPYSTVTLPYKGGLTMIVHNP